MHTDELSLSKLMRVSFPSTESPYIIQRWPTWLDYCNSNPPRCQCLRDKEDNRSRDVGCCSLDSKRQSTQVSLTIGKGTTIFLPNGHPYQLVHHSSGEWTSNCGCLCCVMCQIDEIVLTC